MLTALPSNVSWPCPNNPESSHAGALNTIEVISSDVYWPAMRWEIRKYIASSELGHRITALHHAHYGFNMQTSPPTPHWEEHILNFMTVEPRSMASEYIRILIIIDCLTNILTYLPGREPIDDPVPARMCFEHVICNCGVWEIINTDCGKVFTTWCWDRVCSHLCLGFLFSTAFPLQTDAKLSSTINQTSSTSKPCAMMGRNTW